MRGNSPGDEDKDRYSLVPPHALRGLVRVLMFGAKRHGDYNWMTVDPELFIEAAMRHIEDYRLGRKRDWQSGFHALLHAMCDLMFVFEHDRIADEKRGFPSPEDRPTMRPTAPDLFTYVREAEDR